MFDEIEVDGKWYDAFLDVQNMRLYTRESIELGGCHDIKESKIFTICDKYIVCIDYETIYISEAFDVQYYDILYYFRFENEHYIDGIRKLNKIRYYSKTLEDYMLPLCYEEDEEKAIENSKKVKLEYRNTQVEIEFNRKNYIKKQCFNNTNIDSYIEVSFEETDDVDYIYNLCKIIDKYLKLNIYLNDINQPKILIYSKDYSMEIGEIVINPVFYGESSLKYRIGLFNEGDEKNEEKVLQFIIKNLDLNLNHLPYIENRISYNSGSFSALYSAFEFESNQIYKDKKEEEKFIEIKKKICEYAKSIDEYKSNKEFINGLVNDRINSYGSEYSHRGKLKQAFNDYLQVMPKRAKFYNLNERKKEIETKIYDLRTYIVHNNVYKEFSSKENEYIQYFEWVTHAMLLKRIGFNIDDIENKLDSIFGVG